jgi:hypothetical protein
VLADALPLQGIFWEEPGELKLAKHHRRCFPLGVPAAGEPAALVHGAGVAARTTTSGAVKARAEAVERQTAEPVCVFLFSFGNHNDGVRRSKK